LKKQENKHKRISQQSFVISINLVFEFHDLVCIVNKKIKSVLCTKKQHDSFSGDIYGVFRQKCFRV